MIVQFSIATRSQDLPSYDRIGYLTTCGTLVFHEGRRVIRRTEAFLTDRPTIRRNVPDGVQRVNVDQFFLSNYPTVPLFKAGIESLLVGDANFFESPIKLLPHDVIDQEERTKRCEILLASASGGDMLTTFNPQSVASRLIARFDRGVWSHTATVTGDKTVIEAVPGGVREISMDFYLRPPFRLGLYRHSSVTANADRVIALLRSRIGDGYSFRKATIAGMLRRLGAERHKPTPNGLCIQPGIHLVCRV